MRKYLRRFLPEHNVIRGNRWLAPFHSTLLHPRLWHLNRRSAAGGVAVGLLCGLIPGPLQVAGSSLLSVIFKVNLPVAILFTFYTNPLTIVPLYFVAYELGNWVLGNGGGFSTPPDYANYSFGEWLYALGDWAQAMGSPLALGLVLLAFSLALAGYVIVRIGWRAYLVRVIGQRRARQAQRR
ncbi:MAG: DUF2062 domain-containing protein [Rhodocyclaceae bacterium]|jgi:uncharacterized protein (DUF2062 family)|nr:DUF2062 domain-containing protein [Rhodocyclaceae bacterium]MBK6907330.1 DUF2062 domain-containing protein [Rhodocyclaceae bacterium]